MNPEQMLKILVPEQRLLVRGPCPRILRNSRIHSVSVARMTKLVSYDCES